MLMEMVLEHGNGDEVLWRTVTQELSLSENLQKKKDRLLDAHVAARFMMCKLSFA